MTKLDNNSVAKNFVYNSLLTVTNILFPLIMFPYASRRLLAEGVGQVDFATAVVNYFIMFASLGLPTYGIRACANVRNDKDKLSQTVQELLIISITTTIIVSIAFLFSLLFVPRFTEIRNILLINGISLLLNAVGMNWLYAGLEQYRYITIRSLIFKLLSLLAVFVFVHDSNDVAIYACITVFSTSGANLLNFFHSKSLISYKRRKFYDLKQHFVPVITFFATSIAISIYTNLDVVMLGLICGDQQVGYYSAAMKIRSAAAAFVTSLGTVLLPRLSLAASLSETQTYNRMYNKSLNFTFFMAVPITLFFMLCAEPCICLLAGEDFLPGTGALMFLMPTTFIAGLSNVTGTQLLVPWGKEGKLLFSIIVGATIDFLANLFTIPLWGATGAAFSTLLAEIAVLAVQVIISYKFLKRQMKSLEIYKIFISASIACFFLSLLNPLKNFSIVIFLLISCMFFSFIYIVCLLLMRDRFTIELLRKIYNKVLSEVKK